MIIQKRWHISVLVLTLTLLVGGLLSYTFVKNGYFPVAKVEGKYISYKTVQENIDVSKRIYTKGLAGSSADMEMLFKRGNEKLLFSNVLESLITNEIIKSVATGDLLSKAQTEMKSNFDEKSTANIASMVREVYGWDVAKFTERILEPQALLDVLTKEKGTNFNSWLESSKKSASVSIWFIPFEWSGGKLISK
jgi:hypothetical protein